MIQQIRITNGGQGGWQIGKMLIWNIISSIIRKIVTFMIDVHDIGTKNDGWSETLYTKNGAILNILHNHWNFSNKMLSLIFTYQRYYVVPMYNTFQNTKKNIMWVGSKHFF